MHNTLFQHTPCVQHAAGVGYYELLETAERGSRGSRDPNLLLDVCIGLQGGGNAGRISMGQCCCRTNLAIKTSKPSSH